MVKYPDANHPRFGPESRMVRDPGIEPSTLKADITDSSGSRSLTFHAETQYRGRFSIQARTIYALGRFRGQFDVNKATIRDKDTYHGWFGIQGLNLPR